MSQTGTGIAAGMGRSAPMGCISGLSLSSLFRWGLIIVIIMIIII